MARSLLQITLKVIRGTTEPLRSDTLFGHFCWALVDLWGEDVLQDFLATCDGSDPAVVFSDAFPADTLPRPDFPFLKPHSGDVPRDRLLQSAAEAKRLRSLHYLPKSVVLQILRGEEPELAAVEGGGFATYVTEHVSMDRRNNRALDGALYSLREIRPHAGLLTVYASVRPDWHEQFEEALRYMVAHGMGGSRSVGRGRFDIVSVRPDSSFAGVREPDAFMSLSSFVPAREDPTDGWYRLGLKRGAAGRGMGGSTPFKRAFLFLEPGATFRTPGPPRPVYGRLIRNILPADSRVVQSGFALAVPVRLPVHLHASD